ncbi:MAG: DNA internalization-related competence protein ComEC/Rec2, partial [Coriobacteriia bacterium]|nr:DNA internalization-related competence protein ComEC/Rec2 [Coriobacteriia bacterium]
AVAAWCGVWAGAFVGLRSLASAQGVAAGLTACAVVQCWRAFRGRASGLTIVTLGLAAGVVCGVIWGIGVEREAARVEAEGYRHWSGVVVGDPRAAGEGTVVRVALHDRQGPTCAEVWWPEDVVAPAMGQSVAFSASLRQAEDVSDRRRRRLNGVCASGTGVSAVVEGWPQPPRQVVPRLREWVRERLSRVESDGGALLGALLIGYREPMRGSPEEADFRATGTAHLLAVSGTHVAVVGGFLGAVARLLRFRRSWTVALVGAFAVLQCGLCGGQPSALRACGMTIVVGLAGLGGRRSDSMASLGACVAAIVLIWPEQAFSLGLRLSFCAVGGILAFGRLAEAWLTAAVPRACRKACGPLAVALVAQAATLPISVPVWQTVSNVSPIANLVAVPMSAGALVCGVIGVAASIVSRGIGEAFWAVSATLLQVLMRVLGALASVPWATTLVGATALGASVTAVVVAVAVWVVWPGPPRSGSWKWVAAGLTVGAVVVPGAGGQLGSTEVVFLDVGQGDAVVVRDGGHALLVDGGPDPTALREALARCSVRRLDAVLLTHDHKDHSAGMSGLRGTVRVGQLLVGPGQDGAASRVAQPGCEIVQVSAGDVVEVGRLEVEVLWPGLDTSYGAQPPDENSRSVVLVVRRGELEVLLSGDAEEPVWETMRSQGMLPDCEVLKVPHHGSAGGVSPDNLRRIAPSVAVVSVGMGNEFGHPSPSTVTELETIGARVVRTDTHGDIRILLGDDAFKVRCRGRGEAASACETIFGVPGTKAYLTATGRRSHPSWHRKTLPISNRSTSSSGPKGTCWRRPSIDSLPASPRSPTWTTTSPCSMVRRPRQTT